MRWLVKEGDAVAPGDVIAEIETDKATMEVEAVDEGVIGKIAVADGTDGIKVNTPIAMILEEGESAEAAEAMPAPAPRSAPAASPAPAPDSGAPPKTAAAAGAGARAPSAAPGRVFASPLARRLAAQAGIDLATLKGTGPHGRILRRDLETASARPGKPPAATAPPPADVTAVAALYEAGSYDEILLDAMRSTVARRLTEAKQTIPHFYLTVDIHLDALLAARARANARLAEHGKKLSVNDYAIKAAALALRDVPDCNVAFAGDRILRFHRVDVAVAVAIEGGLFTPVVRGAEAKSVSVISEEMKDLAARARKRRLAPHEYQGGAFTLSNLGMYGIRNFDAVINPPQGSILALGAGEARAVVMAGEIRQAVMMTATLSVDHRAIDGALGAQFLQAIRLYLEDPALMAV